MGGFLFLCLGFFFYEIILYRMKKKKKTGYLGQWVPARDIWRCLRLNQGRPRCHLGLISVSQPIGRFLVGLGRVNVCLAHGMRFFSSSLDFSLRNLYGCCPKDPEFITKLFSFSFFNHQIDVLKDEGPFTLSERKTSR